MHLCSWRGGGDALREPRYRVFLTNTFLLFFPGLLCLVAKTSARPFSGAGGGGTCSHLSTPTHPPKATPTASTLGSHSTTVRSLWCVCVPVCCLVSTGGNLQVQRDAELMRYQVGLNCCGRRFGTLVGNECSVKYYEGFS